VQLARTVDWYRAIGRRLGDNDEIERLLDVKRGTVKLIKKGDAGRAGSFLTR
jgi:hypothetical protein